MIFFHGILNAITLNEALVKVYEKNLTLQSAYIGLKIAKINKNKSIASFLPSANLSAQHQYSVDLDKSVDALNFTTSVDFAFQKISALRMNIKRQEISNIQFLATQQEIFFETVKIFMNIISMQSKHDLIEKRIKIFETSLQAAEKKFQMGNNTVVDVENVKLKLNLAKIEKLQIENNLINLKTQFANLISNGKNLLDNISDENFVIPQENDLISLPHKNHEGFNFQTIVAKKNLQLQNHNLAITGAAFMPVFSVQINKNFDTKKPTTVPQSSRITGQLSLNIIKNGGLDFLNHREAKYNYHKAKYDFLNQKLKMNLENQTYWNNWQLTQEKIDYVRLAIKSAKINLDGITKEYQIGTKNILDLLSAQQDYFDAETQMIEAKKDHTLAHYQIIMQNKELNIENVLNCMKNT